MRDRELLLKNLQLIVLKTCKEINFSFIIGQDIVFLLTHVCSTVLLYPQDVLDMPFQRSYRSLPNLYHYSELFL